MVTALARAIGWQELLDEGRYGSITELAEALGVDRKSVSRILSLATLAPDLIAAIARGEEPSGLSLERIVKGMPWEERGNGSDLLAEGRRLDPH